MDRRSILKGAALAAAVDFGVSAVSASAQVQGGGLPGKDYGGALAKLKAYAGYHLARHGLAGMSVVVADRDGFQATFQLGMADVERGRPVGPDDLFQIGSISKSFAAIAILQAAQAGKLDLESAVREHLPTIPLPAEPRITVRHLLSHTSGLPDDPPFFPRGVTGLWCGFAPGTNFSYSNLGYRLLGMILEAIHQRPYTETIQRQIFDPLGMKDARPLISTSDRERYAVGYQSFRPDRPVYWPSPIAPAPWVDFAEASGSIAAPARDMGRYMRFLIDAGMGKGSPNLSDNLAAQFVKPVTPAPVFGPGAQYALGVGIVQSGGRPLIHHTGGMICFCSSFHVDAPAGVGAFASTNTNIDGYRPRQVTAYACALFRALREGQPLPPAPGVDLGDVVAKPEDYAGDYRADDGSGFSIRAANGGLALAEAGKPDAPLQQKGDDQFLVRRADYSTYLLGFGRRNKVVTTAAHGERSFGRNGAPAPSTRPPAGLEGLAGRYDNDDPWLGAVRVIANAGGLWLDGGAPLVPLPDGSYRIGPDPAGCERVRFDALVNGQTQRLNFSGVDFWREPDPVHA